MLIITLTGGLGAGKSTAARHFSARGAIVLSLDEMSARLLSPDSPLLDQVAEVFGPDVIAFDGSLDRAALARKAFVSPETTTRLNAIVHPVLAREIGPALTDLRLLECPPSVVVLEVPLLAEAPVFGEIADIVLAISAPAAMRLSRAVGAGMTEDDALRRLALQATDEQRAVLADHVIVNASDIDSFVEALDRFWERYVVVSSLV